MYPITEFEFFFASNHRKNGFLCLRLKTVTKKWLIKYSIKFWVLSSYVVCTHIFARIQEYKPPEWFFTPYKRTVFTEKCRRIPFHSWAWREENIMGLLCVSKEGVKMDREGSKISPTHWAKVEAKIGLPWPRTKVKQHCSPHVWAEGRVRHNYPIPCLVREGSKISQAHPEIPFLPCVWTISSQTNAQSLPDETQSNKHLSAARFT